ncbi:hypothetical protein [Metallibacterium scheffleri]|uniref:hypothetical protein n=1 Tax=Metallibacterium scheffleri TaxID=993689 RepID=UPI0023F59502|nr:hypothetical protein [Metallibacterium scheffleri]
MLRPMADCGPHMSEYLTAGGIIFILLGAWLVAFEVVAKFEGQTHGGHAPYGGIVKVEKLGIYKKWERKRNIAMWTGLACITLGSFLQLAGLFI